MMNTTPPYLSVRIGNSHRLCAPMTKAHVAKRKSFPFGHFRRPPTPPTPPPMFLLMASSADCDPRRCPSLPLPVDEDPLATVPAVAVVATVAGLYVVPPLEAQTAPLRFVENLSAF